MYRHKNGIVIKKLDLEDAEILLDVKKESWFMTHKFFWLNLTDQKNWIENINSNKDFIFVFLHNNIKIGVGLVLVDFISRVAQVSGSLLKEYHQTEITKNAFQAGVDFCFDVLNLHKLEAEVAEINIASLKMELNHLGFKVEGIRRKNFFKFGNYYNSYLLGLLRDEWLHQDRIKGYDGSCWWNVDSKLIIENKNKSKEIFNEMFNINDLF